jgi:nicotinamidase-related amidase
MDLAGPETALLVIDIQNTYLDDRLRDQVPPGELARWEAWRPFNKRMREIVRATIWRSSSRASPA